MHPALSPLPDILLQSLGRHRPAGDLARIFSAQGFGIAALPQASKGDPLFVPVMQPGLQLVLQCANPSAPAPEHRWGVHSFLLDAAEWRGGWPEGMDPTRATAKDVIEILAASPDEALCTPDMACFAIPGLDSRSWSALAMFDANSGKLRSFGLTRAGDWMAAPT